MTTYMYTCYIYRNVLIVLLYCASTSHHGDLTCDTTSPFAAIVLPCLDGGEGHGHGEEALPQVGHRQVQDEQVPGQAVLGLNMFRQFGSRAGGI